jgi:metal-responsive CopG/Arc/MetJ family transcriptional regulator
MKKNKTVKFSVNLPIYVINYIVGVLGKEQGHVSGFVRHIIESYFQEENNKVPMHKQNKHISRVVKSILVTPEIDEKLKKLQEEQERDRKWLVDMMIAEYFKKLEKK